MNLDTRMARVGSDLVELTPVEFNILVFLMERAGRAVSRNSLVEHVLPLGASRSERTVDSHVSHLRQKLKECGQTIVTVWGLGYRLETAGPATEAESGTRAGCQDTSSLPMTSALLG